MNEDVLEKWKVMIEWAAKWIEYIRSDSPVEQARYNYQRCINDLAAEVRALRAERDEIKCKAVEESEYIQSHGLTEFEMDRLRARVAELETDAKNWRKVEAMPMNFRLQHEPVVAFPSDPDFEERCQYEWVVLYHSTFTANGATPQEALDRAMKNPQRWVPDFVLTMWQEAFGTCDSKPRELQSDAKLGRMVREMPEGACLHHVVMTSGRSFFAYSEPRPTWGNNSTCSRQADTPAEAMLAVRENP